MDSQVKPVEPREPYIKPPDCLKQIVKIRSRMPRGQPFSGKAKKEQLKQKREKKRAQDSGATTQRSQVNPSENDNDNVAISAAGSTSEPGSRSKLTAGERKEKAAKRLEAAMAPIKPATSFWSQDNVGTRKIDGVPLVLGRPEWRDCKRTPSAEELEDAERAATEAWVRDVKAAATSNELSINTFEERVEFWQQLWRVMERSDILVTLVDARCPMLHLPVELLAHITERLRKACVVALNKADLCTDEHIECWKQYLRRRFPKVEFCAVRSPQPNKDNKKRIVEIQDTSELVKSLKLCQVLRSGVAVSASKYLHDLNPRHSDEADSSSEEGTAPEGTADEHSDDFITLGFIGEPNVGKSSLLNTMFGKKMVSNSSTAGHTRHFQTHYISSKVVLCDSPGIVFPKLGVPLPLQILYGCYPFAQIRDPLETVRFLAERLDALKGSTPLDRQLKVQKSALSDLYGEDMSGETWNPHTICEAMAVKKGWMGRGGGRPDVHRAGISIVKDSFIGRVGSLMYPPPHAMNMKDTSQDANNVVGYEGSTSSEDTCESENDVPQSTSHNIFDALMHE